MSNTERDPQETICENGPGAAPTGTTLTEARERQSSGGDPRSGAGFTTAGGLQPDTELRPARFTDGLSTGVRAVDAHDHQVEVLEPRAVPLGGPRAMTVQRSLPQRARSLIGAWCFLDFYGPDDVSVSGGMRVARHPHTGLATVSWLFEGRIDHIDSAGNWATVRPAEVNLMGAGRGITHSEFSTQDTTVLHGAQLWYAFPDHARLTDPSLQAHRPETITGDGYRAKVFLGSLLGDTSPVHTHLPLTGAELRIEPGAAVQIEVPEDHEHGVLAVSGAVLLDDVEVPAAHLGYVGLGRRTFTVTADPNAAEPVIALVIGGEPLGEQIVMWWNFVGRSHEEIATWRVAYRAKVFLGSLLGDTSPVHTHLPLTGAELRIEPGAAVQIEVPEDHEHGVLAVSGAVLLDDVEVPAAHLGYVGLGRRTFTVTADPNAAEPVIALVIGGEPLGEQIVMWWNFVGRSHEEIATWRAAYQEEMGFEAPKPGSPLIGAGRNPGGGQPGPAGNGRGTRAPEGTEGPNVVGPLEAPVSGEMLDGLLGDSYDDGRPFPQFGDFPPDQPAPIPAPELPNTRMRPRG